MNNPPLTLGKTAWRSLILNFFILFISLEVFAQPSISTFSPANGPSGSTVTITGNNFSATPASNIVFFGAVRASVTSATTTTLMVTIPAGATYQPISVTTNGLTAYSNRPFVVTFSGAATQFTSKSFDYVAHVDSVDSNIETTKYTIGDLDNDGRIDVVTIDRLNNTMSVYRNTSAGGLVTFEPKNDFNTGASPRSVTVADIDGDGKQDAVVTNFSANTVSIFKNTTSGGTISFSPKIDFATATQPAAIAVTDFDKDGKPDLVINTVNLQGYVSVLRNTGSSGTISFAPKIDLQSSGGSIEEVRVADLDGDAKPEIVLPNYALSTITIFRNTASVGNISFAAAVQINAFTNPTDLEIGDLNGDGKLDMVVGHYSNPRVMVVLNVSTTGNIVFQYMRSTNADIVPTGIAISDLDGDSKPDLVVANGLESFSLYKNISSPGGDISFDPGVITPAVYNSRVLSADFNGDGKTDLAFNTGILRVTIWKNNTTGPQIFSFTPTSAKEGDTIIIQGANFTNINSVSFGGAPAASFSVQDASTISAVLGSGATGVVKVTSVTDSGTIGGFLFLGPPVISSFTPASGASYEKIIIKGLNFSGTTEVKFGGVPATFSVLDPFTVEATISTGASGDIMVANPYGTATKSGFVYIPSPVVSSFLPVEAITGMTVTIKGFNFSGVTSISFGGTNASSFAIIDSVTITAVVGNGSTGNVSVTNGHGTRGLAGFTYLPPPIISSISPASGGPGAVITISGSNFSQASAVKFGGTNASSFKVISSTAIEAIVGGGSSGIVSISTFAGTGTMSGFSFIPPPRINSFSPASGPIGTSVTITGSNFSSVPANNIVYFGSVRAQVTAASATSLTVVTPPSANYQRITVTANGNTGYSNEPFKVIFNAGNSLFTPTAFSSSVEFPGGDSDPFSFSSADLDGDGKPEAILPDNYGYAILVFRNTSTNGILSFAPKINFPTPWVPYFLTTADFNGDGKKDVAVINGYLISVFINASTPGNIAFAPRVDIPTISNCTGIISDEIDGDGRPDLIVWRSDYISILQNKSASNGEITFSGVYDFYVGYMSASSLPMRFLDLDNDKKPEMIFAEQSTGKVSVYRNTSVIDAISFAPKVDFTSGPGNSWLAPGDIDGDGKPDIVTNSETSSATLLRNLSTTGNISFAPKIDIGAGKTAFEISEDVNIGDMNGDGKVDIVVVPRIPLVAPPPPRNVLIYKNNSAPGNVLFDAAVPYIINAPENSHIYSVIDDFNNDGRPDVASAYNSLFSVIANQAGGPGITSFTPTIGKTSAVVTITGNDFTGVTGVSFGGIAASSFTVNSDSSITAVVASGASGIVSVTGSRGTATKSGFTYIPAPVITSFTPAVAGSGTTVTIKGMNFTGTTTVSFGGVSASSFTVTSDTTISAVVSTGASGMVSVTAPGGTADLNGFTYSTVTGIVDPGNANSKDLLVSPNPSHDVLVIRHPASAKNATLRFVDMLGHSVKSIIPIRLATRTETSVSHLRPGVYVIIWSDGRRTLSRVITVQ